jgi:hypothetical protein
VPVESRNLDFGGFDRGCRLGEGFGIESHQSETVIDNFILGVPSQSAAESIECFDFRTWVLSGECIGDCLCRCFATHHFRRWLGP